MSAQDQKGGVFFQTLVQRRKILFEICTTTGRFSTHVLTKKFCFRERDAFVPLAGGRPVSFSVMFYLFLYWRQVS